jgi:hypothetical protein
MSLPYEIIKNILIYSINALEIRLTCKLFNDIMNSMFYENKVLLKFSCRCEKNMNIVSKELRFVSWRTYSIYKKIRIQTSSYYSYKLEIERIYNREYIDLVKRIGVDEFSNYKFRFFYFGIIKNYVTDFDEPHYVTSYITTNDIIYFNENDQRRILNDIDVIPSDYLECVLEGVNYILPDDVISKLNITKRGLISLFNKSQYSLIIIINRIHNNILCKLIKELINENFKFPLKRYNPNSNILIDNLLRNFENIKFINN